VLIALGGLRVDQLSLPKQLERFNAGETVSVAIFRDDELKEFNIMLAEAIEDTCVLSFSEQSEGDALHRRKAWIGR
jgi:predicted metalloprotease with PDZ domain